MAKKQKPAATSDTRENRVLVVYNDEEMALIRRAADVTSLAPATWVRMVTVQAARGGIK